MPVVEDFGHHEDELAGHPRLQAAHDEDTRSGQRV